MPAVASTDAQITFAPYVTQIYGAKRRVCETCHLQVKTTFETRSNRFTMLSLYALVFCAGKNIQEIFL